MDEDPPVIRARANAQLKDARAVARGREDGRVLLEGTRLVVDALRPESPLVVESVLVREGEVPPAAPPGAVRFVAPAALDGIGSLRTTPPVVAVASVPAPRGADALAERLAAAGPGGLVVCVSGVADPGNLGALARSAEASGALAFVVAGDGGARPFGPKALRGSMGSLLRVPVFEPGSAGAALDALDAAGFESWTAATRGGESLHRAELGARTALWLTGETGAGDAALARCRGLTIPMAGAVESLNVAVAGSLLMFEFRRRRNAAIDR
ncbi:MAG: RNA methyltransferase [Planctomycetota bacterium]